MELVEYPTSFHSIVEVISGYLSFDDIRNLSLCSKEWFKATEPFVEHRSKIHNILSNNRILHLESTLRTYRNFVFHDLSSNTAAKNLEMLAAWYRNVRKHDEYFLLHSIKIYNVVVNDKAARYLNDLEWLDILELWNCDLDCDKEMHFALKIRVLNIQNTDLYGKWERLVETIRENSTLRFILDGNEVNSLTNHH